MSEAFVRFFCRVTEEAAKDAYGDLAIQYFRELKKAQIPMRVIATNMADLAESFWVPCVDCKGAGCEKCDYHGKLKQKARWAGNSHFFVEMVPKSYINVVCGDEEELKRLYTVGVKNIAIYNGHPSPEAVPGLQFYDFVITPTLKDAERLQELDINAIQVNPQADELAFFI